MSANYVELELDRKPNSELNSQTIILSSLPIFHGRSGIKEDHTASWFNHDNTQANESREKLAHDSLEMLIQWLKDGGNVGIHGVYFWFW